MKSKRHLIHNPQIIDNTAALIDLPLYLVVTIIIGIIALASILSMIYLPSFYSPTPIITITPTVTTISTSNTTIHYQALVTTKDHQPIADAHVIIKNDQTIATNITNQSGMTTISIQASIPEGLHELFFDVIVKTASTESITHPQMLKVVLRRGI